MNKLISFALVSLTSTSFAGGSIGGLGGGGAAKLKGTSLFVTPIALEERAVNFENFRTIVAKTMSKEVIPVDDGEYLGIGLDLENNRAELKPLEDGPNIVVKAQGE